MSIFDIFHLSIKTSKRITGVNEPNLTISVQSIATFSALLTWRSLFQYSIPLQNGSTTMKIRPPETLIFHLKLIAMAMSLEQLPNECKIH